jgi:hypothetical protein
MWKIVLAVAVSIFLAVPSLAQVPTNASTTRIKPGKLTIGSDGSSSYRANGYSSTTDSKGNTKTNIDGYIIRSTNPTKSTGVLPNPRPKRY